MATSNETAADTLALLEERIKRIDYAIHGDLAIDDDDNTTSPTNTSATSRLRNLEHRLASLTARSPAINDILSLQKEHPTIFSPSTASADIPHSHLTPLVLAHARLYTSVHAHLTQLQSQSSIPDSEAFIKLINLAPRIEEARKKQESQMREVAELRARSAGLVERWYEEGVLGMGEKWAGWEERARGVEIAVRRREAGVRREEGVV